MRCNKKKTFIIDFILDSLSVQIQIYKNVCKNLIYAMGREHKKFLCLMRA